MKRFLITVMMAVSAAAFCASPAISMSAPGTVRQEDGKKDSRKKTRTVTFNTSIHCKNCVNKLNDNLAFEKGVKDLKISLDSKQVTITYDPSKTDEETLAKAIEKLGYKAEKVL